MSEACLSMLRRWIRIVLLLGLAIPLHSQRVIRSDEPDLPIQPMPKHQTFSGRAIVFPEIGAKMRIFCDGRIGRMAGNYLKRLMGERGIEADVISPPDQTPDSDRYPVHIRLVAEKGPFRKDQYYTIDYSKDYTTATIRSSGILGLLFGCVTLHDLIVPQDSGMVMYAYRIRDWPSFGRRHFHAVLSEGTVEDMMDFALRQKMETVALASRQFPWHAPSDDFLSILDKIKDWKDAYGGPRVMQMHNIYAGKAMAISNPEDVEGLKEVIRAACERRVDKLMILADDTMPFEFGEGYVLPGESDRDAFLHAADAHCRLIADLKEWLDNHDFDCELYYVPAFYTFEDMYYGDMSLYVGTPWERQAFDPLARDLSYIGAHLPEDVFIIWSGPNVRSRVLRQEDIDRWCGMLEGRVPFLWDNTIYSHHPFTTTALFTAYDNDLPNDLHERTDGNGMCVNGDANSEEMRIACMTANDYLWNPGAYDPDRSLAMAMAKRYGEDAVEPLLRFRDAELELRKTLGQRDLWFVADTLWAVIRQAKGITGKNPLHYHLNYNLLKAGRMQMKYSVPEPLPPDTFQESCRTLRAARDSLLEAIRAMCPDMGRFLESIAVAIPDG